MQRKAVLARPSTFSIQIDGVCQISPILAKLKVKDFCNGKLTCNFSWYFAL